MEKVLSSNCCSGSGCDCSSAQETQKILIDFLYLDLSVCERCHGTENNLIQAVNEVTYILKAAGYEIDVNKVNITSKELAVKYKFLSSPTIRINGKDIDLDVKESDCKDCGDLCGDSVDCRVWTYENREYAEPPKAMIINAILKQVYGGNNISHTDNTEYVLPENLQKFFEALEKK